MNTLDTDNKKIPLSLLVTVMTSGKGSEAMSFANKLGAKGKTVLYGDGIVGNVFLQKLGFVTTRKEVLFALVKSSDEQKILDEFSDKFKLSEPNRGIAFTIPISFLFHTSDRYKQEKGAVQNKGEKNMQYEAILIIVNKGSVDAAIDAAAAAGATGGTVLHGRGIASEEKISLFDFKIEPEKEVLIILSPTEKTDSIIESVKEKLELDKAGHGILFVMDVSRAVGLYCDKKSEGKTNE